MKAYNLHGVNELKYEDVEKPQIDENSVLVEVKAAGVCGSDIPRIFETGTYHFPTIPGHEFSGIVREVGDEKQKNLIGKRVGIFPLIPCKTCANCKKELYEMCSNYNYLGSRTAGGFAEYVKVPVWNLIELPDKVSYEEAAMLEPACVGIHALKRMPIEKIKSICIFGLGPIGMIMAQWAKYLKVEDIYLIGNKQEQVALAKQLGFENICNIHDCDMSEWIKKHTNNQGVDAVVDGIGRADIISAAFDIVKTQGHVLLVGNPKSDMLFAKNAYWKILRKQLVLYGTWNSSYATTDYNQDDWRLAVKAIENGAINLKTLITHKLPFENLQTGLEIMRDKKGAYCKVMITRDERGCYEK